jgi:hypothetical protein
MLPEIGESKLERCRESQWKSNRCKGTQRELMTAKEVVPQLGPEIGWLYAE